MEHDTIAPATLDPRSDDELVAGLDTEQASDALASLQARYGRRIQHFVRGMVKDPLVASDLAHEVFEKAYLKRALYAPGTSFRAWLFEVARNHALTTLRANKRAPRPISGFAAFGDREHGRDPLDDLPSPSQDRRLEDAELLHALDDAVGELPEPYRDVFEICVRRGETYEHAAQTLGLPTGTVAIRIMRARQRLFRALARHLGHLRRPPACVQ